MRAIDTNIFARFYVDDPGDPEAAKQRPSARRIMVEGGRLFVPLTVVLELEWVLRAFYRFEREAFTRVIEHLLGLVNVRVESWTRVGDALTLYQQGLEFADALRLVASVDCDEMYTFDDRRFARRTQRLNTATKVMVPDPDEKDTRLPP
jgi:predicted nucleic-acid-binding protein